MGVVNANHGNADGRAGRLPSDDPQTQSTQEVITVGPQANFTLLDQMSEIKKNQGRIFVETIEVSFSLEIYCSRYRSE